MRKTITRINLCVSDDELKQLARAVEYHRHVVPGSEPTVGELAKSCMISGLNLILVKADTVLPMERVKKKI